jgi:hypothetical protein
VTFTNCSTSAAAPDARPWIATNDVAGFSVIGPTLNPTLKTLPSSGLLILQWDGGGSLQTATSVTGTYSNMIGVTSPYTNNLPNSPQRFFRVSQ